jgi:type VI secretion system Hcp family effector
MAHTMYMKISGIPGESADPNHKDWIEILNYSQAVARADRAGNAPQFMDLAVNKYTDRSSPLVAMACYEGWRLQEVTIETCAADGRKIMEIRLTDAEVTNYNVSGGGDPDHPAYDSVCLRYGKLEWLYYPKGSAEPVKSLWTSEEYRGPAVAGARRNGGR